MAGVHLVISADSDRRRRSRGWRARLADTEGVLAWWALPLRRSWRVSDAAPRSVGCPGASRPEMSDEVSPFLSPALAELAGLLLSTDSFTELVQQVAELAVRTVEPATTCGITLAEQGRVFTVAAADQLASQLDEQQYELDNGPCLQALHSGEVVDAEDLRAEPR